MNTEGCLICKLLNVPFSAIKEQEIKEYKKVSETKLLKSPLLKTKERYADDEYLKTKFKLYQINQMFKFDEKSLKKEQEYYRSAKEYVTTPQYEFN